MVNEEHLEILTQGFQKWNKWRQENPNIKIAFNDVDEEFFKANCSGYNLSNVDFINSSLYESDFSKADLSNVNFSGADLSRTNLYLARLIGANLSGVKLTGANLNKTNVKEVQLRESILGNTTFTQIDLSKTYGLEKITHLSPSNISTNTIQLSEGNIPEVFLRGCGLSDWEIEAAKLYKPGLSNKEIDEILYKIHDLRAQQSIQISPLFISYSHANTSFVEKLEKQLIKLGIRFWRDVHNATAGRLETQIDHAMRQNPTVLLVLSNNSTASDWVEHEARLARELEKEIRRDVLCPIALDDSWKTAKWPTRLMEQIMEYNILDFSRWEYEQSFEKVFNKMLSGLDMFYKPEKESSK
jgi:hypothetical protein